MFCPKCKSEYVEGVNHCADCGVPLVDELVPGKSKEGDLGLVCILETFNSADIAMIESILEGSDTDYYIQGENVLAVTPYVIPVRVLVVKEQVEKAKELLKDLDLTYKAIPALDLEDAGTDDDQSSEVENGEGKA